MEIATKRSLKWLRAMAIKGCGSGLTPEDVASAIIKEIRARSIQEKLKQAGVLMNNEIKKKIREGINNNVDVDEIIDELLCEDLDLIVEPDLHDEHLSEHLDEQLVEPDEIVIGSELSDPMVEKEAGAKKRGRPKKSESDATSKSSKHKEMPES